MWGSACLVGWNRLAKMSECFSLKKKTAFCTPTVRIPLWGGYRWLPPDLNWKFALFHFWLVIVRNAIFIVEPNDYLYFSWIILYIPLAMTCKARGTEYLHPKFWSEYSPFGRYNCSGLWGPVMKNHMSFLDCKLPQQWLLSSCSSASPCFLLYVWVWLGIGRCWLLKNLEDNRNIVLFFPID